VPSAGDILVGTLVGLLFKAPVSLASNAMTGWIDNAIGEYFGLTSPSVTLVVQVVWQWVVPFGAAVLVLVAYHHWNTRRRSPKKKTDVEVSVAPKMDASELGVYLECQIAPLPLSHPANGRLYVLDPFPSPELGGGLVEFFTLNDVGELRWPKSYDGIPLRAYRCRLTSYRNDPIFQITMVLRLTFRRSVLNGKTIQSGEIEIDRPWQIEIAKLDTSDSGSFEFYVYNQYDKFIDMRFPPSVSARTLLDNSKREIPLIQQSSAGVDLFLPPFRGEEGGEAKPTTDSSWVDDPAPLDKIAVSSPFPSGLHISRIWVQRNHLAQRSVIHINLDGFNGTGEDVFLTSIKGNIIVRTESGKPIWNLAPPTFAGVRNTRIDAYREFCITLEQDIPKRLATEMLGRDELDRSLVFDDLDIIVQAVNDPSKTARLPLWDGVALVRNGGEIRADRQIFLRAPQS
jgi:hypothetical protein